MYMCIDQRHAYFCLDPYRKLSMYTVCACTCYCCLCYWLLLPLQYLDHLFERDPKCGGVNHERQVELYAKFDSEKLLPFLRSCNDIPLQNVNAIYM